MPNENIKRKYKIIHVRELGLLYMQNRKFFKATKCIFQMIFSGEVNPIQFVRFLPVLIDAILCTNVDSMYQKIKYKIGVK